MTKYERFLNRQIEVLDDMDARISNPTNREMLCVLAGMVYTYNSFARDKTSDFIHAFEGCIEIIQKAQRENTPFYDAREKVISHLQVCLHPQLANIENDLQENNI